MKKLLAITLAAAMLVLTMACCDKKDTKDKDSDNKPETMATITENNNPDVKYEELVIEDENYKYILNKTDFEDNYSDELLLNIVELIPMSYGADDYDNWDGTPEEVINDAIMCNFNSKKLMYFERYDSNSPEWQAALDEIAGYEYKVYDNYSMTSIDMINSYLAERFGPDARQFTPEDFDTYEEAVTENGTVAEDVGLGGYRYIYLPESEVVMCYMYETTGFGGNFMSLYIYDVQTVGEDYVVKAVATDYYYEEQLEAETFEDFQSGTLTLFESVVPAMLENYTMVIGETEDGDVYMKSVEITQLTSEK